MIWSCTIYQSIGVVSFQSWRILLQKFWLLRQSVSLPWMEWFGVIVTVPCIDKVGIKSINISTLYICIVFMMVWCGYLHQITFIWIRGWVLQNQYHAPLVFNWKVQTKIEATSKDRHLNNKRVSGRCLHYIH